jgi:hypothetical protein
MTEEVKMRRSLVTGLMVPVTPKVIVPKAEVPTDLVNYTPPKAKPEKKSKGKAKGEVTPEGKDVEPSARIPAVEKELADVRAKFAALDTAKRGGKAGDTLIRKYRHLSLEWATINPNGGKVPKIYDDMDVS